MVSGKPFYYLQCVACGAQFDEKETSTSCLKCHDTLDVIYDYHAIKRRLNMHALKHAPISSMKYVDFYPINDLEKIVSLQEGGTPLYHAKNLGEKFGLNNLYIKNEGANPTGVFKDRGTLVEITKAVELGAKAVCLASSGNMAASCAAYTSIIGLPCYVLVPEGTPIGKLSQTLSYGARVLQIRAPYSRCAELAEEISKKHGFYLAGDYVFRAEGQKSQSYEIIEQLNWEVPDYLVCPVGCGTNMSGIWKGFKDFYEIGVIDKLPKLIGVQPSGCAPVHKAFHEKKKTIEPWERVDTLCSAVAIYYALDGTKVLKCMYESNGDMVTVSDKDALMCEKLLAQHESIFIEPSGGLGIAAVQKLSEEGFFKPDDTIAVIATGNGLKDAVTALKYQAKPATLEPNATDIGRYLDNKLYNLRAVEAGEEAKDLWKETPSQEELIKAVHDLFSLDLKDRYIDGILEAIKLFIEKGKAVTKRDLQLIIENTLQSYSGDNAILKVNDYTLNVYNHKRPQAHISLTFNGKDIEISDEGVGPVAALINAIRKGIADDDTLDCKLSDYNVRIQSGGTNAAVEVRIKVKDKDGNEVLGSATSPDIIQASIDAFVRGYNSLYWYGK